MAYLLQGFFGEKSLTKVVGIFGSETAARAAAMSLAEAAKLAPDQVRTLSPQDESGQRGKLLGRKIEPEGRGIVRTLVRAHLVLGVLAAAAGFALYEGLRASGQPAILASPWLSLAVIVGFACHLCEFGSGERVSPPPSSTTFLTRRCTTQATRWRMRMRNTCV